MRLANLAIILGLLVLSASHAKAQDSTLQECYAATEKSVSGFGMYAAQDAFIASKNEDRDYTFGASVAVFGNWIVNKFNPFGYPLKGASYFPKKWLKLQAPELQFHYSVMALRAFTPDSLNTNQVLLNDRPYASELYLSFGEKAINRKGNFALNTEFKIVVLGSYLAREMQTWFHQQEREFKDRDQPYDPLGWDNQIANGGELSGQLSYELSGQPFQLKKQKFFQYIPKVKLALGYQTYVGAGVAVRVGLINSPWWTFNTNGMENGAIPAIHYPKWYEVYWFAQLSGQFTFYDALLQGQFKSSNHNLSSTQIEQLVARFETGLRFRLDKFDTWATVNVRTSNYSSQTRNHYWMSLGGNFYF